MHKALILRRENPVLSRKANRKMSTALLEDLHKRFTSSFFCVSQTLSKSKQNRFFPSSSDRNAFLSHHAHDWSISCCLFRWLQEDISTSRLSRLRRSVPVVQDRREGGRCWRFRPALTQERSYVFRLVRPASFAFDSVRGAVSCRLIASIVFARASIVFSFRCILLPEIFRSISPPFFNCLHLF